MLQGLKEYSKWPTYPQLYINGELIGGLDIVKEMLETGDLDDILIKKDNTDERQVYITVSLEFQKRIPEFTIVFWVSFFLGNFNGIEILTVVGRRKKRTHSNVSIE